MITSFTPVDVHHTTLTLHTAAGLISLPIAAAPPHTLHTAQHSRSLLTAGAGCCCWLLLVVAGWCWLVLVGVVVVLESWWQQPHCALPGPTLY